MNQSLTPEERVLWQGRLTKAETTYDLLVNGRLAEQFIDQNGEQVRYTKTNLTDLESYIASIRKLLNPELVRAGIRRPMGFIF